MNVNLLKPKEVDLMFRYPSGRTKRLAKAGKIPFIKLPDGEMRFDEQQIKQILNPKPKRRTLLG
jgi:predicted site-specific integrase-resolvase